MRLDPEAPVMRFLSRVFDLALLQILFLLTSIPVFTVGAGLTAVFSVCRKLRQDSVTSVIRTYFADFKDNFKSGTAAWLIMLACISLLLWDIRYYQIRSDSALTIPLVIAYVLLVGVFVEFLYVFPLMAWFDNKLSAHFRNAPMLALRHILPTVLAGVLYGILYYIVIFPVFLPLTFFLGVSGAAYLATMILSTVFQKHGSPPDAPEDPNS